MRVRYGTGGPRLAVATLVAFTSVAACGATGPTTREPARAGVAAQPTAVASAPATVKARPRPPLPSREALCRTPVAVRAKASPQAKPFVRLDPGCADEDHFCAVADRAPDRKDVCFVATENISRAEREARATPAAAPSAPQPWDGKTRPLHLDRVDAHLHLTQAEHARLATNGFVVLDRLPYASYAAAFHDVFQEELPLYVGVDAILWAVGRETELSLETVERKRLLPALKRLLAKTQSTLSASKARYPAETVRDLDLYLAVASGLLRDTGAVISAPRDVAALIEKARTAGALEQIEIFGRPRMVDFSQFAPRGHYSLAIGGSEKDSLETYFRTVMWLSRVEMNLVSRSSASSSPELAPNETPREARLALALADLVERSGASDELALFEETYAAFGGAREDVPLPELARLARANEIRVIDPEAPAKLRAAIGEGYKRKARTHFTVEGVTELPAIATMLGPRVVPDVAPLTRLVHDAVSERRDLSSADVGFLLGHDRGRDHLTRDLAAFPALGGALLAAREELARDASGKRDLYASWLRAILALGAPPGETRPAYMRTPAYADFRMGSALAGYAQLRHAYTLLAAQGYDVYGCEIPDAWVEPLPAFWDALLDHVKNTERLAPGTTRAKQRVLTMLRDIARVEARGAPLSEPQRRWLGMVSENIPFGGYGGDSHAPPKWTGWYFDLFADRHNGATLAPTYVADYMTLTNAGHVRYLGTDGPRLAVFVVDTGGAPRVVVGPVAKGYETTTALDAPRLDDASALTHGPKTAPWRASFAVPDAPAPALGLEGDFADCPSSEPDAPVELRAALRADVPTGRVSVTLLDHHGDAVVTATGDVDPDWRTWVFELPPSFRGQAGVSAFHVEVHDLATSGRGTGAYHYATAPSVFQEGTSAAMQEPKLPRRPDRLGYFAIGQTPPRDVTDRPSFHPTGVAPPSDGPFGVQPGGPF